MTIYLKKFYYTQKLQKQIYDKDIKFKSSILSNIVSLNSKYIKTT